MSVRPSTTLSCLLMNLSNQIPIEYSRFVYIIFYKKKSDCHGNRMRKTNTEITVKIFTPSLPNVHIFLFSREYHGKQVCMYYFHCNSDKKPRKYSLKKI